MGPTEIDLRHHEQQTQPSAGDSKYHAEFFSTVDAPTPPGRNTSSYSSSGSSASQRALRSGSLRFATFQGWPHSFLSPRLLADAGFFYRGTSDQTQCAFCCITISQWEPNDDPMTEHRKYAPNCPFVLNLPVGNIPIPGGNRLHEDTVVRRTPIPPTPPTPVLPSSSSPINLFQRSGIDVCGFRQEMRPNALPERVVAQSSTLTIREPPSEEAAQGTSDYSALRLQIHQKARHPELATLEARLNSFREWPASLAQRPPQLAEAGFFYMKTGDHVKCFCCDGALRNWEPNDEPWVEHARWFSRCNFLLSIKGEDFVKEVHSRFENGNPSVKKSAETASVMQKEAVQNQEETAARHEPEKVEKEEIAKADPQPSASSGAESSGGSSLQEALLCKICFDQQMSIVFLPCGHSLSCPSCATALSNCPLCRKPIQATVRAFFSFS